MKEELIEAIYGICYACWIFGVILACLSFMIALYPENSYFTVIGILFLLVHFLGLILVIYLKSQQELKNETKSLLKELKPCKEE